ncbi:DUF3883 domain-containing protein [Sneathiella sp.]|uniref:DUF3883 domain-containing protein n=1 Tax=Sneathiella sp. TaxID=1964365 RepID=UPI002FE08A35
MSKGPWTDEENDLIVADYFSMLEKDLAGHAYNKAEHNRNLQRYIDRSRSSIEFKHQNISAVLKGFGEAWIPGYVPAFNYQFSLEDAVWRWMEKVSWAEKQPETSLNIGMAEPTSLFVDPPPTMSNQPPPAETEQMIRVAKKFDIAARDARNRKLGYAGEKLVFERERAELIQSGREDLARKVRWVSQEDGDGAGYDIASFKVDGQPRLIEVKTTNGWERTPFYISRNEIEVSEEQADRWCLFRLWNFSRKPRAFELYPPLSAHVALTATSYEANIR